MSPRSRLKKSASTLNRKWLPRFLIIVGIALVASTILILKSNGEPVIETPITQELPEEKLDRLLEEEKPILLFFHSNNCNSCLVMIDTVSQVYPEFMDSVVLVDVNIYDERNQNLLRRAQITTIPTQIFINNKGEGKVILGIMQPEVLRENLSILIRGK
ncbi:MAG: thioredoxin fold domain-containing protein [Anaerolineaceae bacterium]|nr:thioredoxin fold domain-containing protein [Anaerolineaceae bacterium]